MKRVLLIGCGAEIGINLLLLNQPARDGFVIDTVITNSPAIDKRYPDLSPIHGIYARAMLAQPAVNNSVSIKSEKTISFAGRDVDFHFLNVHQDPIEQIGRFDGAILATSKEDVESEELNEKIRSISDVVLGVAESDRFPSVYPCLLGMRESIPTKSSDFALNGIYCIGSCQTNGMHASLRLVIMALSHLGRDATSILSIETDIIHPDTPTGTLGTKSFEGRLQDCRDNLRPSFSQISKSLKKVMPWASMINTVSLRAPIHAPGYQINRFIISDQNKLSADDIVRACDISYKTHPDIVKCTNIPLGSRAYSFEARCSTILSDNHHLIFSRPPYLKDQGLTQLVIQSYVNNTIGYSANVLNAVAHVMTEKDNAEFFF